jgi:hypothetical protein
MRKSLSLFFGLSLGLMFLSTSASAQPQCDKRDKVLGLLADKYKEAPVALGVTNNGGLVEVLSTNEGTTWSIIVTAPDGKSCLVAAGEGWRALEQVALDPET